MGTREGFARLLGIVAVGLAICGLVLAASVMPTVSPDSPASDALEGGESPVDGAENLAGEDVESAAADEARAAEGTAGGTGSDVRSSGGTDAAIGEEGSGTGGAAVDGGDAGALESLGGEGADGAGVLLLGLAGLFAALGGSPDDLPAGGSGGGPPAGPSGGPDSVSGNGEAVPSGTSDDVPAGAESAATGADGSGDAGGMLDGTGDRSGGFFDVPLSLDGLDGALGGDSAPGGSQAIDDGSISRSAAEDAASSEVGDVDPDAVDGTEVGDGGSIDAGADDVTADSDDVDTSVDGDGVAGDGDVDATGEDDGTVDAESVDSGADEGSVEGGDDAPDGAVDASTGDADEAASIDGESAADPGDDSSASGGERSLERSDLDDGSSGEGDSGGVGEMAPDGAGGSATILLAVLGALVVGYVLYTREDAVRTLLSIPGRLVSLAIGVLVGLSTLFERAVGALTRLSSVLELPGLVLGALLDAATSARDRAAAATDRLGFRSESDAVSATGTETTSTPRERVREAWETVVAASTVYRRRTATPAQVARSATASGAPREPVETITEAFRDVEYGDRDPGTRVEPVTEASRRLRAATADESDGTGDATVHDGEVEDEGAPSGDDGPNDGGEP